MFFPRGFFFRVISDGLVVPYSRRAGLEPRTHTKSHELSRLFQIYKHTKADGGQVCSENLMLGFFACSSFAPASDTFDCPNTKTSIDGSFSIEARPASVTAVRNTLNFLSLANRSMFFSPSSDTFVVPRRSVSSSVNP